MKTSSNVDVEAVVLDCGHTASPHADFTTGYGTDKDGKKSCYACCAESDKRDMIESGRAVLYFCYEQTAARGMYDKRVSNWPNSLSFPVYYMRIGAHNITGKRYDVWFNGPDGYVWHGVTYGDMTQLCHCRRIKERVRTKENS